MSDYDVLFGVVLRLSSPDGKEINENINELTRILGETIAEKFKDIYVTPFGMELVESDSKLRILNKIAYPVEDDKNIPGEVKT